MQDKEALVGDGRDRPRQGMGHRIGHRIVSRGWISMITVYGGMKKKKVRILFDDGRGMVERDSWGG